MKDILAAARASIAAQRCDTANELALQHTIQEIELLEEQTAVYDAQIAAIPVAGRDLLTTIPGIGVVLAAVILAEIGSIDAFRRVPGDPRPSDALHRLLAFAGLDPRIRESGQWSGKVRMSKRGSRALRTALYRAAFMARGDPAFKDCYDKHKKVMKQPGKVVLSHVARKVLQAVYGVLRYQTPFDPIAFKHGVKAPRAA